MKIKNLLVLVFAVLGMFWLLGCDSSLNLKAEFKNEIENAVAYVGDTFDLEEYIEKQPGVDYSIKVVYLDADQGFLEVEVETDGLKFTPTVKEDVFVTLTACKGKKCAESEEVRISVDIKIDAGDYVVHTTWADDTLTKIYNYNPEYLLEGSYTSVHISHFGAENNNPDRYQLFNSVVAGIFDENFSVTDWSNAVIEFWVYNPMEEDIEINLSLFHKAAQLSLDENPELAKIAKAGEWTHIMFPLAYYGMVENFHFDSELYYTPGQHFSINGINIHTWKSRYMGRPEVAGQVFFYEFYVDGFDISDYDPERHPGLDTTFQGYWGGPHERNDNVWVDVLDNRGFDEVVPEESIVSENSERSLKLVKYSAGEARRCFDFSAFEMSLLGKTLLLDVHGTNLINLEIEIWTKGSDGWPSVGRASIAPGYQLVSGDWSQLVFNLSNLKLADDVAYVAIQATFGAGGGTLYIDNFFIADAEGDYEGLGGSAK